MFWNANHSSPSIDTILAKEDLKLGEVLDHETIFQDLRGQNQKLLDYITRADVLNDLVTLVTEEPSPELAENERYRWPNAACEVLTTNMPRLNENLSEKIHLVKLFSFFENDPPLNPLLSSFVSRALSILISRKVDQHWYSYQLTCLRVLEFLKSTENSSQLLIKHLGTSAVMDLLLKFLTQIEGGDMQQNLLDWIESVHLVENIVALFHPSVDADRQGNAAQLLCDTIEKLRINEKDTTPLNQTILDHIQSPEIVKKLLENMLDQDEKSDGSITGGITVLLALLDPSAVTSNDEPGSGDASSYLNPAPIITEIVPYLPKFHDLLINPPKKDPIKLSCGVIDPPLGIIRLSVIKLISTLIASNTPQVNEVLDKLNTVQVLLDLFFHYTWNNFLHSEVDKCLAFALSTPINDQDNPLLTNIFVKCRLIQRIISAWEDNEQEQGNGGRRRGYMGHLTNIANSIVKQCGGGDLDAFLNESLDSETMDSWRNYVNASLEPINELHQKFLGGHHPAQSNKTNSQSEYNVDFSNEADLANSSVYNDVFDFDKDDLNEEMLEKENPFAEFWSDKDLEEIKQSLLLEPEEAVEPWSQTEKCDSLNEGWANFNDQDFFFESPKTEEIPDPKAQIEVKEEVKEEKIDPVILDDKCEIGDPLNKKSDNNANLNNFIKGTPHEEELIDNFRFLSNQGMMSETPEVPQSQDETVNTPSENPQPVEDRKPETPQDPV